ncbi:hypothetical protein AArcSl_0183 [Halalkaliarchaeum desulfuricum]|uniref:Uncharacterized protein n=1 Tax=Halalkaliarchaeum desulfuricum TaxID=2055893 RepID=A0A343TFG6_9EURY|nr:hypothetical protein [Halalkaliarchaeum desulfuricum]AUX07838.1 hypothetical protein AArcSl_0183 [Halalkaliarchaeum desulfuricum]
MFATVAGLLLIALGLAMGWYGIRPLLAVPRLLATEVREPRSLRATGGFVACRGRASAVEEPIEAPFSGTDCLGLEYEVTERQPFGIAWPWIDAYLDDGVATTAFDLVNDRGRIRVDPAPHRFTLDVSEEVISFATENALPDRVRRFLEIRDVPDTPEWLQSIPGLGRRRFVERRIDPGREYVVFGRIERRDGTVALGGDLVIGEGSPSQIAMGRIWSAAFPLGVSLAFLIGGGLLLFA